MSWIQKLYETYENNQTSIGYSQNERERPLLPICHITTQAHIEIVIDGEGNFKRARIITDKKDVATIIPCTEGSAGRAGSRPKNHPLCDKLQYIAGDFREFGGKVTSGFSKKREEPYLSFVTTLSKWCQSEFSHAKAEAVLKYIKKKNVVKNLAEYQILLIGEDGKFLEKDEIEREKNTSDIFSAIKNQEQAFVRWVVEIPGTDETEVWKDKMLWESWINYYLKTKNKEPFCFVSGKDEVLTTNHPRYIRREGDGAKLISSNDSSGFTYRGRFLENQQACNVSLEVSQKAHYALLWLISRQGYRQDDQVIVAWATSGVEIPKPMDDSFSLLDEEGLRSDEPSISDTKQDLATKLKKKIAGYNQKIDPDTDIIVMGLDSATPGRLAITYYRELKSSNFLERLNNWHETCSWAHRYRSMEIVDKDSGKTKKIYPVFVGAPAPRDIAEAAYGTNNDGKFHIDDKLRKSTVARILPCIIDDQPIPRDIVESATRKASNRIALDDWQWNKTLSIACALYKKYKEKENYTMALDESRNTRAYLYGRLLAIADKLEEVALFKAKKKRATNATRYMQQFSQHPYRTWEQLHSALIPYMVQLDGAFFYKNLIGEVKDLFASPEDYTNDKPLSGEYLLGYYSQRQKLQKKKDNDASSGEN